MKKQNGNASNSISGSTSSKVTSVVNDIVNNRFGNGNALNNSTNHSGSRAGNRQQPLRSSESQTRRAPSKKPQSLFEANSPGLLVQAQQATQMAQFQKQMKMLAKNSRAIEEIIQSTIPITAEGSSGFQAMKMNAPSALTKAIQSSNSHSQLPHVSSSASIKQDTHVLPPLPQPTTTASTAAIERVKKQQQQQSASVVLSVSQQSTNRLAETNGGGNFANTTNQQKQTQNMKGIAQMMSMSSSNQNSNPTERQGRIEGQIKRYMNKMGLQKKDRSPVFYTFDENGKATKTTFAQVGNMMHSQNNNNNSNSNNNGQQQLSRNPTKRSTNLIVPTESEESYAGGESKTENINEILKICNQLHKTIEGYDRKNSKKAKRTDKDFRMLNNKMKQLDLQNLIIDEQEDPLLQPYLSQITGLDQVKESRLKKLLN